MWWRIQSLTWAQKTTKWYLVDLEMVPLGAAPVCSVDSVTFLSDSGTPATDSYSPVTAVIPDASESPSMVLAAIMLDNPFDYLGSDLTVDSPWTMLQGKVETSNPAYITDMNGVASCPNPPPSDPVFHWGHYGNAYVRAGVRRIVGFAIDTAATAPVQVAPGGGGSGTFPGDITPGNILVMVVFHENVGHDPDPDLSSVPDWHLVHFANMMDSDVTIADHGTGPWSTWDIYVLSRCVGPDESGDTIGSWSSGYTSYVYLQEWALA
jgi:hypothetical protein